MTFQEISLIISLFINAITIIGILLIAYVAIHKGHFLEMIQIGTFLIQFDKFSMKKELFEPVADEWFDVYSFDQNGRLWEYSPNKIDLSKGLSLYWLGHDLLWTAIALKTNLEPKQIRRGFTMAAWQMEQSGISHYDDYKTLKKYAKKLQDNMQPLSDSERNALAATLVKMAHDIGLSFNKHVINNEMYDFYLPLPPRKSSDHINAPYRKPTNNNNSST